MSTPSLLSVVRTILTADGGLTRDAVAKRVAARGLKVTDRAVKKAYYNAKAELRKGAPMPAPAAARQTAPKSAPKSAAAVATSGPDLSGVFSNVTLVNAVVGVAGGVDQARQVAEAVRACGGVDAFLQHLDLVAGIRTNA